MLQVSEMVSFRFGEEKYHSQVNAKTATSSSRHLKYPRLKRCALQTDPMTNKVFFIIPKDKRVVLYPNQTAS